MVGRIWIRDGPHAARGLRTTDLRVKMHRNGLIFLPSAPKPLNMLQEEQVCVCDE